jgi:hypothetical protein
VLLRVCAAVAALTAALGLAAGPALPAQPTELEPQLIATDGEAHDLFGLAVAALALPPGVTEQKLQAADGVADDWLGASVAIDGDVAVVGAPQDNGHPADGGGKGAVYVFERSGAGWTQTAKLTASDGELGDSLGWSVAIDGNTIVAGAPDKDLLGSNSRGAVYTFARTGPPARTETARLTASDGVTGADLGQSVAIDGDTIVAGAHDQSIGSTLGQGAVYTFTRSGAAARTETARLTASDGVADDHLGYSVAIDGDTIVAGAAFDQVGANAGQGSVYTFARTGAAARTETAKLTASDGAEDDLLGDSVAIEADTIVAGAPNANTGPGGDGGAVYTFARTGPATRTQTGKLTASDDGSQLGTSVTIEGETIVAGDLAFGQGAIYTFARGGAPSRTEIEKLTASDGADDDLLGWSVAIGGDTILAGAPGDDSGKGSVSAFRSARDQRLDAADGVADDEFGRSVAFDGDTAVVGAPGEGGNDGAVYVFERRWSGWVQVAKLDASGGSSTSMGISVDVDGDTIVAGAHASGPPFGKGAVFVFAREGPAFRTEMAKLTASDGAGNDFLGQAVAIEGDTIVAGARNASVGSNPDAGAVYQFTRSGGGGWSQTAKLTASDGANDRLGAAVAIDGDTIVAGAPEDDLATPLNQGSAYTFAATGASDRTETAKLTASDAGSDDQLGVSVAIEGDTIVAGAHRDDDGTSGQEGSVYTFARTGAAARNETAKLTASDGVAEDRLGFSVAIAGDTIVAGAPHELGSAGDQGSVYAFTRTGPTARTQTARLTAPEGAASDQFGSSVDTDAQAVFAGAYLDDVDGVSNQGSAWFVHSLPAQCGDGQDNDGDGQADHPADPGCASPADDSEADAPPPPPARCADGQDNDSDGKTDHPADPGCQSPTDDSESPDPPPPPKQCEDGQDNDSDGKTDHPADPGCQSPTDDSESPDPPPPPQPKQCSDGVDNDGDGKTDEPADPGCASSDDDSESPDPPPISDTPDVDPSPPVNVSPTKAAIQIVPAPTRNQGNARHPARGRSRATSPVQLQGGWIVKWNAPGAFDTFDISYRKIPTGSAPFNPPPVTNNSLSVRNPFLYTEVNWRTGVTSKKAGFTATSGYTYCFTAVAKDPDGNVTAPAEACTALPHRAKKLDRPSGWQVKTGSGYYLGGYLRWNGSGGLAPLGKSLRAALIGPVDQIPGRLCVVVTPHPDVGGIFDAAEYFEERSDPVACENQPPPAIPNQSPWSQDCAADAVEFGGLPAGCPWIEYGYPDYPYLAKIVLVATRCPSCGKVKVAVHGRPKEDNAAIDDGAHVLYGDTLKPHPVRFQKTVNLTASTVKKKQLITIKTYAEPWTYIKNCGFACGNLNESSFKGWFVRITPTSGNPRIEGLALSSASSPAPVDFY